MGKYIALQKPVEQEKVCSQLVFSVGVCGSKTTAGTSLVFLTWHYKLYYTVLWQFMAPFIVLPLTLNPRCVQL